VRDYITLGSSPGNENCTQLGSDNYDIQSRKECLAFKHQLERLFSEPPEGCYFSVKSFSHDFGTYKEVVCYFDDSIEESCSFAYNAENNTPGSWDKLAKEELRK
jgi:hypothetical protein